MWVCNATKQAHAMLLLHQAKASHGPTRIVVKIGEPPYAFVVAAARLSGVASVFRKRLPASRKKRTAMLTLRDVEYASHKHLWATARQPGVADKQGRWQVKRTGPTAPT